MHSHKEGRRGFEDAVVAALDGAPEGSVGVLVASVLGLTPLWHRQGPEAVDAVMAAIADMVAAAAPAGAVVARIGEVDLGVLSPGGEAAVLALRREINHRLRAPVESAGHTVAALAAMATLGVPTPSVDDDEVVWCVTGRAIASRTAYSQMGMAVGVVGEGRTIEDTVLRLIASGIQQFDIEASRVEVGDRSWSIPDPPPEREPDEVFELRTPWSRIGRWSSWGAGGRMVHSPWLDEMFQSISLLLERALNLEASELRSRVDPLTGLLNREGLAHAMAEVRAPYAVAVVDIDHFKLVNDRHGHDVGDRFLFDLGRLLCQGRSSDLVARWGGEELVIVMPGTDADGAAVALRRLLEEAKLTIVAEDTVLSFSAGVTVVTDELLGLADGIRAADVAMYEAKRDGRSRVVVATPD